MKTAVLVVTLNFSLISMGWEVIQRWAFERIHGKPKIEQPVRAIDGKTGEYVIINNN